MELKLWDEEYMKSYGFRPNGLGTFTKTDYFSLETDEGKFNITTRVTIQETVSIQAHKAITGDKNV